jgi:DNA-binding response OmpR family regulator
MQSATTTRTDRPRLLIVEDDPSTAHLLTAYFQPMYDVTVARDGIEGFDAASTGLPDVIVADVMMPRLDGFAMVRRLRAEGWRAPVIFLTAKSRASDVIEGIHAGAFHFMPKPFQLDQLAAKVAKAVGRK